MFEMKKLSAIVLAASMALLAALPVSANGTQNEPRFSKTPLTDEVKQRMDLVTNKIVELSPQGQESVQKWMSQNHLVKLSKPMENPDQVSTQDHSLVNFTFDYYRDLETGKYVLIGNWSFEAGRIDTSTGSEEVVSLSLWKTDYTSPSGITWSSYPTRLVVRDSLGTERINTTTYYSAQGNGFIWKYQDYYNYTNGTGYLGQSGTGIVWADVVPSTTLYGGMNYEHTYSNLGSINSATIEASTQTGI